MTFGTVTLGPFSLRETFEVSENGGADRRLALSGEESMPPLTEAQVLERHDNILGLDDSEIPVLFSHKADRNGFYRVRSSDAQLYNFADSIVTSKWSADLERIGTADDVEFESRLTFARRIGEWTEAVAADYWHAPPVGAFGYYTGSTSPASVTRVTEDGTITVYRSLPTNFNPRWGVREVDYYKGSARVLVNGVQRVGTNMPGTVTSWEIKNGFIRVAPGTSGTTLTVGVWDTGAYRDKTFNITEAGVALTTPSTVSIVRNTPDTVILRLMWNVSGGRTTVDLTIKRGAAFVAGYWQRHATTTVGVADTAGSTTASINTGTGLVSASNDANGNRYVIGSSKTTNVGTNGTMTKASVNKLDFYIGYVFNGGTAVGGNTADDLARQYMSTPAETTRMVRK